jgi:M6 family metalloprotease-like protein
MSNRLKVLFSLVVVLALASSVFLLSPGKSVETSSEYFDEMKLCQLPTDLKNTEHLGFPRPEKAIKTTGSLKSLVILVDFKDLPYSEESLLEWRNQQIPTFEKFTKQMSYGKLDFKVDIHPKVIHLNKSVLTYKLDVSHFSPEEKRRNADFMSLINDTVRLADSEVDFSQYEFLNIVAPPTDNIGINGTTGPFGMKLDNRIINYATFGSINEYYGDSKKSIWFLHEAGHAMGLSHPYAYYQMWSAMGSGDTNAPEFLGWERFLLSWFDQSNVLCIANQKIDSYSVKISPLYKSGTDAKMLVYRLSENSAIVVEYRSAKELGSVDSSQSGVLVYKVQTNIPADFGAVSLLFGNISRPSNTIKAGEFVRYEDLEIKVDELSDDEAFVTLSKN